MPYEPANTARLYLDYTAIGRSHTLIFRFPTDGQAAAAVGAAQDWAEQVATKMYLNTAWTGARMSAQGVDVTNPLPWDNVPGAEGSNGIARNAPRFVSWVGRTSFGTRARWFLYGVAPVAETPGDYRYTGEEDVNIAFVDDLMRSFIEEMGVVAVDFQVPILKSYVNTGYNTYHQRQQRS